MSPVEEPRTMNTNFSDNIHLIGTAHVSEKSVKEVEEAIDRYQPDVVAIELDDRRYKALTEGDQGNKDKELPVKELLKGSNLAVFLLQTMLAWVQRKVGAEMGVKPGSEMLAAIDAARKRGIPIALIDRDISITMARFWAKMTLREKLRMAYSLLLATLGFGTGDIDMEQITNENVVSDLVEELREFAPSAAEVLVYERDAYLANNLLNIGRSKRVLGVVGAGHREGIKKYLGHPETIPSIESISVVPKRRHIPWLKIISAIVILSVVFICALLLFSGIPWQQLLLMLAVLFFIQGVVSATFVALIGGHWKSVAMAFVSALSAAIHPLIAIGWLAGIVEATQRPPTMGDLSTLLGNEEDSFIEAFRNLFTNRLFRVIAVAAVANVGSIIGAFIGVLILAQYFNLHDPVGILHAGLSNGYHAIVSLGYGLKSLA
ncbi:MAG TPA: TraB/GumN family protein [Methanocella sp.]|uniref:TraB/GumN family protein n=1 Tax=Methanocella sp. TaxID=2052833 RepID=UPI002D17382F|nr:TraB/GumN family protein [Methanocella sp.]HTY90737.1 TraB/GumN family protein [Methanocella sp.]